MKNDPGRQLFAITVLLLAILAIRIVYLAPIAPDSWLHIGIGRYIIDNKRIPTHSQLSFKKVDRGLELIPHSWISDILTYVSVTGSSSLSPLLLLFPLLTISLYILYKILKLLRQSSTIISSMLVLAMFMSALFWKYHPLAFATPLTLLLTYIFFAREATSSKILWFIPPIFLVFANVAGGYILIPGILFLLVILNEVLYWIIATFILEEKSGRKSRIRSLIVPACASFIMSLANPSGIRIWHYGKTFLSILPHKWFSSLPGALIAANTSFIKNPPSFLLFTTYLILFLFVIFATMILLIRGKAVFYKKAWLFFPLFWFLYLGFIWMRFIPLSVFCIIPFVAFLSTDLTQRLQKKIDKNTDYLLYTVLFAVIGLYILFPPLLLAVQLPEAQISYIKNQGLHQNILPTFELTSYVYYSFYPAKGHLDAQDDFFDENDTINVYSSIETVPQAFFDNIAETYDINTVISTKQADYINSSLSKHSGWDLYYLGSAGNIFAKKSLLPEKFIALRSLSHIDFSRNLGFDPKESTAAAQELERFIHDYREPQAIGELASIYRFQKRFARAEETLMKIPQNKWDLVVMAEMGRLSAAQGKCKEAEYWFLQALDQRSEKNTSRVVLDLAIVYAGCLSNKEKALHYFKRYNSFVLPPQERDRTKQLMKDFGVVADE